MNRPFLALFLLLFCSVPLNSCLAQVSAQSLATSKDGKFHYETFGAGQPLLILLHGSGGPDMPFYREQAKLFASKGYTVIMPHYFDATGSHEPTTEHYQAWVNVVQTLLTEHPASKTVVLLGYSLGASIALAAGSENLPVTAIAEWYGSLPDDFFYHMQGMPPLLILHGENDTNIPVMNAQQLIKLCAMKQLTCESHIYSEQGHGFRGNDLEDADQRTLSFFSRFLSAGTSSPQP